MKYFFKISLFLFIISSFFISINTVKAYMPCIENPIYGNKCPSLEEQRKEEEAWNKKNKIYERRHYIENNLSFINKNIFLKISFISLFILLPSILIKILISYYLTLTIKNKILKIIIILTLILIFIYLLFFDYL